MLIGCPRESFSRSLIRVFSLTPVVLISASFWVLRSIYRLASPSPFVIYNLCLLQHLHQPRQDLDRRPTPACCASGRWFSGRSLACHLRHGLRSLAWDAKCGRLLTRPSCSFYSQCSLVTCMFLLVDFVHVVSRVIEGCSRVYASRSASLLMCLAHIVWFDQPPDYVKFVINYSSSTPIEQRATAASSFWAAASPPHGSSCGYIDPRATAASTIGK
mgnify:CR=1 FL=1